MSKWKKYESDEDIYFNSCLHLGREEYVNNKLLVTFLLDRRFVINEEKIISLLQEEGYEICQKQDKYFLVFKTYFEDVNEQIGNRKSLFLELQMQDLIISTYDFILNFKP